jgi:hypothetical protein
LRAGVPLELSSQAYGLHVAYGDLKDATGGGSSDRSFREIGVPSASYNDPLRRGVVVPGYGGHKPGEIERYGHAPTFVPPRNSSARAPDDSGGARINRPTSAYQDMAQDKMPFAEDRTDSYLRAVGGVVANYAGHVPNSQHHFGSRHIGGVNDPKKRAELQITPSASNGRTAQRDHTPSKLDYYAHEPAKDASRRAVSSMPGYGGHKRGDAEAFGASYWSAETPSQVRGGGRAAGGAPGSGKWAEEPRAFASAQEASPPWYKQQAAVQSSPTREQPGRPPARLPQERPSPAASPPPRPSEGSPAGRPTMNAPRPASLGQRRPTLSPDGRNFPPAGLSYENAHHGLAINLWEHPEAYSA